MENKRWYEGMTTEEMQYQLLHQREIGTERRFNKNGWQYLVMLCELPCGAVVAYEIDQ